MAAVPTKDALMGYHLLADVKHDFGTGKDVPMYNIGGEKAALGGLSEDDVVKYCLEGAGKVLIKDYDARKKGDITFPIVTKTASFRSTHTPLLFGGGNDKVGIVHDAGSYITGDVGARNVLTFGSILDPASKPNSPATAPIWFQPAANTVDIPLRLFGFDDTVSSIRVSNLTAGTVKASFVTPTGTIDAVRMGDTIDTPAKLLNTTKIDKSGFFVGIEKVETLDQLLQEELPERFRAQLDRTAFIKKYKQYFYIAKTLGDTMLVASCMPNFLPTPNPFYGLPPVAGAGQWKSWITSENVTPPSVLMLKTGDRLNWLRAILFEVPTIYEQQAKAGKAKHYRFFPGQADEGAIRDAILSDFTKLGADCQTRYQELSTSLGGLYGDAGVDATLTTFAPGGQQVLKKTGAADAKALIVDIQAQLDVLSARVTAWIETRRQTVEGKPAMTIEDVRAYYTDTLAWANACTPQTNTIFIQKGKNPERYLSSSVIVAKVPKAPADISQWPLQNSIDIALRNAFARLNNPAGGDIRTRIAGTDIDNRFFQKIPAPAPAAVLARTDDIPLDIATKNETIAEVVGKVDGELDGAPPGQVGGANLHISINPEYIKTILESFPTIRGFIEYIKSKVPDVSEQNQFLSVFDVVRRRNTDRVFDAVLASTLTNEFQAMISNTKQGYAYMKTAAYRVYDISPIFADNYAFTNKGVFPSNSSTLLFNAYTYSINATNAKISNTDENVADSDTQASIEFTQIEKDYFDKLARRYDKVVFGPFVEVIRGARKDEVVVAGGFRPRRPLYSIQPRRRIRVPSGRTRRMQTFRRTRRRTV